MLDLSENGLTGKVPPELVNLTNLIMLDFSGNQLTGCIPESVAELAELGQVSCNPRDALVALYESTDGPNWNNNDNWLSDAPIGEWYGVTTDSGETSLSCILGLTGCRGAIPPELGYLRTLTRPELHENKLSGQIPPEFGRLSGLRSLALHSNELSGTIPAEMGRLEYLELAVHQRKPTERPYSAGTGQSHQAQDGERLGEQADRRDPAGAGQAHETGLAGPISK